MTLMLLRGRDDAGPRSRPRAAPAVLVVILLAGCTGGSSPEPGPTTSPASSPTAATITVPVFYATGVGLDLKLAREFRALPDIGGPGRTAAAAVLAGKPLDPDYRGLWNPAGKVLGVRQVSGAIDVDLTAAATPAKTGPVAARLAVQTLVYAVTGALGSDDPVRILVAGELVEDLFGVLDTREPIARANPIDARLLVQINQPNQGDVVGRTVTVNGEAAVFEATLPWRVQTPDGATVRSGVVQTAEGQTFAPFAFDVTLDPGSYVVVITQDDPSGAGGPLMSDTRAIVVR